MSSFTITTPSAAVRLQPSTVRRGEKAHGNVTYSVSNRTGATVRTRLRIDPGDGADSSWFSVRDGEERDIPPGATQSFSVDIEAPAAATPARCSFLAVAVNLRDSDNDFATSPAIEFETPALAQTEKKFPWWVVAIAAVLVLMVAGAVTLFLVLRDDGERPIEVRRPEGFHVAQTYLFARPNAYGGPCPTRIEFEGGVRVDGGAGIVRYRFARSDGATAPVQELTFDGPGERTVTTSWTLGAATATFQPFEGWQRLEIIEPAGAQSDPAHFVIDCRSG